MPNQYRQVKQADLETYQQVSIEREPRFIPPAPISTGNNLMSSVHGNVVPMRGILPIEIMSDSDLYRFFPYTPFIDRIPKYTYYQLQNET